MNSTNPDSHVKPTSDINTVLFDWDGTIVDSAHLGLAAYQKAFAELNIDFCQETYEANYSPNWHAVYEALGLPAEQWDYADSLWRSHYDQQFPELIEGVAPTLQTLRDRGYRLGVVTSGNHDRVLRELVHFGMTDVFETLVCHEHITQRKPHPEGLEIALANMKSNPAEAAYVGDAPEDIQMGKQSGVLTVAVLSNYPCGKRLLSSSPDIYLEKISRLVDHFPGISRPE